MRISWISSNPSRAWVSERVPAVGRARATLAATGREGQVWEGFGGCFNELGWIALSHLASRDRDAALRALFAPAGCGFTHGRLPIGASDYAAEWYSHNEVAGDYAMRRFSIARDREYLLPYLRAALRLQPDMTLFASPWSPPTWLKHPRAYNFGTLVWDARTRAAYARYFVKFIEAYRREGIHIRQVHPQNEPVADQKFPSCKWTGAQLRDFIRDNLAPALRRAGLDTEVWLGTLNTADYDGFVHQVLSDPRAHRAIAGVGFQWDGRGAIQRTRQAFPEKRLMQTENECGDGQNTWAYAHYIFGLMQHYLTNGAHAYLYWNMVLEPGGRSTWGWLQNAMLTVDPARRQLVYNPEFYVMKHAAHFIKPGAVRLELEGPWAGNAFAFRGAMGRTVTVVQNPHAEARPLALATPAGVLTLTLRPQSINTVVV